MFTTKSLYSQIVELINKKATSVSATTTQVLTSASNEDVASLVNTATTDDVLHAVSDILGSIVKARIISGLQTTQTTPPSDSVAISSGTGTADGKLYTLTEDTIIPIPFNVFNSSVYYINLYDRGIVVENRTTLTGLTIAKVVIQNANAYSVIYDQQDDQGNAYIQCYNEYTLYGINDKFEEDTTELLRDNIGAILADNIIGNIRLSENLKIVNTSGTLQIDSQSLEFTDFNGNILTLLDPTGIYFRQPNGVELAKFSTTGARIGNIVITPSSLQSGNYSAGTTGFIIRDTGDVEFNNMVIRGTIYATAGQIGGFTIGSNSLYATTTGTIKTSSTAGSGSNGVVLDKDGLRGYNSVLGIVFNLPTDGSAPTFSSGIINSTIYNLQTSSVIRTSTTVGDGTSNSAGILINNTGFYATAANQTLSNANVKIGTDGNAYFKGEINAASGIIGSTTITATSLSGGLITGSEIISAIIETSASYPRVRIDNSGVSYQVTASVGKYAQFLYGDGTKYGSGVLAYLFNPTYPAFAVVAQTNYADIRLFNRTVVPSAGSQEYGDLICVNGVLKICTVPGSPGTFSDVGNTYTLSSITGTLAVNKGGTNLTSYTVGDLIYASGTTTLSTLADVATGNALISGGVTTAPSWGKIGLTTHISGILNVVNGGFGADNSAVVAGEVPIFTGTGVFGHFTMKGIIVMWSGTIATIPTGWVLCNGSNSTPDLRNLFIVGADADSGGVAKSTVTGSALQTSTTGVMPAHTHSLDTNNTTGGGVDVVRVDISAAVTGSVTTASTGTGTKVIAVFYALAFIMKT